MKTICWQETVVAPHKTHHIVRGQPLYDHRFDEVLKFHAPGLAPVRSGGQAWHITLTGESAYSRRFHRTFGYYENLAAVVGEDGWRHIRPDGVDAYQERYSWCGNFQGGRCPVRTTDGHYFHIDDCGRAVYAARWRYCGDYRDDIAVVQREDGRSTHIDRQGRFLHTAWFLDLDVFHKGYSRALDEHGWMHLDEQGRSIYSRRFAMVEPFYNGQARVETFDGALEVVSEEGITLFRLSDARLKGGGA